MIQKQRIFIACLFLLFVTPSAFAKVPIIPQPKSTQWSNSDWLIPDRSQICYQRGTGISARWLQKLVSPFTKVTAREMSVCKKSAWSIVLDPNLKYLGNEGYRLSVSRRGVVIASSSNTGLFYAIQTLRQLLPAEVEQSQTKSNQYLPIVQIEDAPLYTWRGSMLDVARSFYGVEYIKHHIDRMALFKLNRLHLHLTDDQGWRIEIKKYPNLTSHGGSGSVQGGRTGFYTQDEYKEIQKYARDRYITIIPEIEMPGHIYAALSSYPELNCANLENLSPRLAIPPELYRGTKVKWNSLCLEKAEVKTFVSDVLQEISKITEGPWIHIGGDEVDVDDYGKFISFVDEEIYRLGKITIGWQEILQAPTDSKTLAQIWMEDVPNTGKSKIISLCENFYLDHSNTPDQGLPNDWCKQDGVSLENLYGFTSKGKLNVLGIEAPLWTEFAHTPNEADDRIWPRLAATAEVAWSLDARREITDFRSRLALFGTRLDLMGIRYFETPTVTWVRGPRSEAPKSIFFNFTP